MVIFYCFTGLAFTDVQHLTPKHIICDKNVGDEVDRLEIQKMHTALLDVYTKTSDLKSAKQYAQLVTTDLPADAKYTYILKAMYSALTDYFEQMGITKKL